MTQFMDISMLFGKSIEAYIICILIGGTIFFISRWLLRNLVKNGRTRIITALVLSLVASPFIYMGLVTFLIFGMTYTPSENFDKNEWLKEKADRYTMASDIIKSKMLIGRDTNQVKQIVGEPTRRSDSTYQKDLRDSWFYDMGSGGGALGIMFHSLIVKFDENKVVAVQHGKTQD